MGSQTEISDPDKLLDAGWRARRLDDRHDLAHDFFSRSLESARSQHNAAAAAKALLALATNLMWYCPKEIDESDLTVDALCEEASELFREVGDESGIAACLRGIWKFDDSLAICQRINDQAGIIRSLERLAVLAASHDRHQEAGELCTRAIMLARELGDKEVLASVLNATGICWQNDDVFRRSVLLEAAELFRVLGHRRSFAESLQICATLACDGDMALKEQLLEDARAIWHELGRFTTEAICLDSLADVAEERGDEGMAAELRKRSDAVGKLPEPN
jgi:tetratricopeptide (TPR) repeat protein